MNDFLRELLSERSTLESVDLVLLYLFQPIFTLFWILARATAGVYAEGFILNSYWKGTLRQ